MKCDACGVESDFDAGFIRQRLSFTWRARNVCPACWTRRANTKGLRLLASIPVLVLSGIVLKTVAPGGFWGELLFNLGLIQLFLVLCIVPHEAGHAVTARALGWRVYQVTIGLGSQVWKTRWHGILVDLRALPIAGATFMVPQDTRLFRPKFFLAILAGPLVNAVMAGLVVLLFGGTVLPPDLTPLPNAARLFVFANFFVMVVNLWPFTAKSGMAVPTDGKRLLQLISFRKRTIQEVHATRFMFEAQLCRNNGDLAGARAACEKGLSVAPESTHLLNFSGVTLLDTRNYEAARAVFCKLLEKEKPHSATKCTLLNNIAYADALSNRPEWLPEADAYSRDAFAMVPWIPAVVGTRGTVLVALGKYQEGIELLKRSIDEADTARSKAENACHIVIALARMGQTAQAEDYFKLATDLDPQCLLLPSAAEALSLPATTPTRVPAPPLITLEG